MTYGLKVFIWKKSPILRFQWILAIFERRRRSIFIAPGNAGGSNAYHTLERRRCSILIPYGDPFVCYLKSPGSRLRLQPGATNIEALWASLYIHHCDNHFIDWILFITAKILNNMGAKLEKILISEYWQKKWQSLCLAFIILSSN